MSTSGKKVISLYMELLHMIQDEHDRLINNDLSFIADNLSKKEQIMDEIDGIMNQEKVILMEEEKKEIEMIIKGIMDINRLNEEKIRYHQEKLMTELSLLKNERKAHKAYIQMG